MKKTITHKIKEMIHLAGWVITIVVSIKLIQGPF